MRTKIVLWLAEADDPSSDPDVITDWSDGHPLPVLPLPVPEHPAEVGFPEIAEVTDFNMSKKHKRTR